MLQAEGISPAVQVNNVAGAGGTVGLAQFVSLAADDPSQLIVGGYVMVGAILTNGSPVSMADVTPIARLTDEADAIVVPVDSPIKTIKDLVEMMKADPGAVNWAGGSAGGVDHITVGLLAKAAGVDPIKINYVAFSGGGEALAAILGNQVSAGISGVGELESSTRNQGLGRHLSGGAGVSDSAGHRGRQHDGILERHRSGAMTQPMTKRRPDGAAFAIAAFLAGFGGLLIWDASRIVNKGGNAGVGPGDFPKVVGFVLVGLAVWTVIAGLRGPLAEKPGHRAARRADPAGADAATGAGQAVGLYGRVWLAVRLYRGGVGLSQMACHGAGRADAGVSGPCGVRPGVAVASAAGTD